MNSEREVLKRLLRLYPIKLVKDEFQVTGSSLDTIETIVETISSQTIKSFAAAHFNYTKQHIYVFNLRNDFIRQTMSVPFPLAIVSERSDAVESIFFALPLVKYSVVLLDPTEEEEIDFLLPVTISVKGKQLIIQFTIMEKKLNYYFGTDRRLVKEEVANDEEAILQDLLTYFGNNYGGVDITDLNKGVKHIWNNDMVDCKYVKYRKSKSQTTEAMDEDYTLKEHYPIIFAELMNSPLNKTVFKYKLEDENFCDHFTVEPSAGEISVILFPKNINQINNVLAEILRNN